MATSQAQLKRRELFNPDVNPLPGLFQVPRSINPFENDNVRIFGARLYTRGMPSVKSFMARHLLERADWRGELRGIHTLVEGTSANTGQALALLAPEYGIRRMIAVVQKEIPAGKRKLLEKAGAEVIFPPKDATSVSYAEALGTREGWLNLGQYRNEDNYAAHERWTGPHIWEKTDGKVSIVAVPLGTTGTAIGISRFLRGKKNEAAMVGVAVAPGEKVSGARTLERLKEVALPWQTALDHLCEIGSAAACHATLRLHRFEVGLTSGLAFAGLMEFLATEQAAGNLNAHRNSNGTIVAVFTCGDDDKAYAEELRQ